MKRTALSVFLVLVGVALGRLTTNASASAQTGHDAGTPLPPTPPSVASPTDAVPEGQPRYLTAMRAG